MDTLAAWVFALTMCAGGMGTGLAIGATIMQNRATLWQKEAHWERKTALKNYRMVQTLVEAERYKDAWAVLGLLAYGLEQTIDQMEPEKQQERTGLQAHETETEEAV